MPLSILLGIDCLRICEFLCEILAERAAPANALRVVTKVVAAAGHYSRPEPLANSRCTVRLFRHVSYMKQRP